MPAATAKAFKKSIAVIRRSRCVTSNAEARQPSLQVWGVRSLRKVRHYDRGARPAERLLLHCVPTRLIERRAGAPVKTARIERGEGGLIAATAACDPRQQDWREHMNRTGLFLLVAVVVAAGAAYWYMNRPKPAVATTDPAMATDTAPATDPAADAATDPAAAPTDPAAAPADPAAAPTDPAAAPADGAAPPADPVAPPPPPGDPTQQ
jgi:hypothetical protein